MDKRLAALIACSIGFGQIAGASPISEARIQELMASRDRQEVKLEALRSRDREILVQLGQMLSEKYGGLLEGSEMVFTRLVEQGTVYYRMDFVGLKGRDRARALCEILEVEKCIALGPHGQMTLLQTDGDLTVSAMGVVEDTRPFAVLSDEPAATANPKARQIEERVRRMLDPLGIFPMPRPDHIEDAGNVADAETPAAPREPTQSSEQVAGRSEIEAMLEDGLSRAPQASLRPRARPEEAAPEITIVEYFEEPEEIEASSPELDVVIEIEEPVAEDMPEDGADSVSEAQDILDLSSVVSEVFVEIDEPAISEEVSLDASASDVIVAPSEEDEAPLQPTPVIILPDELKVDAKKAEANEDAPDQAGALEDGATAENAASPAELLEKPAPVILLPEDVQNAATATGEGDETPQVPEASSVEPTSDATADEEPRQAEPDQPSDAAVEVHEGVEPVEPASGDDEAQEDEAAGPRAPAEIEWEEDRPAAAPDAPRTRPVPAPEETIGPMMLTPDMQIEIEAPLSDEVPEVGAEPAQQEHSMLTPDKPASLQERLGRDLAPRDIASTREAFLSGGLGTSPAASNPQPGRTIAMRLPGLGEVDLSRLSPAVPDFGKNGTARFPEVALQPDASKEDVARQEPEAAAVEAPFAPAPRITELPSEIVAEKEPAREVAEVAIQPSAFPVPVSRSEALGGVEPPMMRLASGPEARDVALSRVMAKVDVAPLSRETALDDMTDERRVAKAFPEPSSRDAALKGLAETRLAEAAPTPQPRTAAIEAQPAEDFPEPAAREIALAEAGIGKAELGASPAPSSEAAFPARVAMVPLDGGALKNGFQVNIPLELAGMKGAYEAVDAPRLASGPKVEVALLGTVHFDDQFAVPASLDFAHGRDAGRLQKLPDPRPDLEAVVKRQVSRAGQAAIDPQAARLALDISRGLHPGATLAQVPGLGGTASPDHGIAPPGFFEDAPKAETPKAEQSPSLDRLGALLETIEDERAPEKEPEVEAAPVETEAEAQPSLTGLDALLMETSRPKLTTPSEAPAVKPTSASAPEPSQSKAPVDAPPMEPEKAPAEVQDEKPDTQTEAQRQALEILSQIARRAEAEREEEKREAVPAEVPNARPEATSISAPSLAERAAAPAKEQERPDFDSADLRIELSYVDSREAVKTRAKELRGFFPPVMLEKGRFFGAAVPGRPGRYIVGLEARDLKSRDDLIWYMDQMGMPWAMR